MEKTIDVKEIFSGKILKLQVEEVELPNGRRSTREIVRHPGAVGIIPFLDDDTVVMVKQYRKPVEDYLIEIPAGKLEEGEDPLECAKRELEEETGYRASLWEYLGFIYTSPGFSDEKIHIYRARYLFRSGDSKTDEDEFLDVIQMKLEDVEKKIATGEIVDSKTLSAFHLNSLKRFDRMNDK